MTSDGLRHDGERGIALVVVLWMLALLAVLILGFAGDTRTETLIVRNQAATAQARANADAGVTLALLGMLDPSPAERWSATGEVHEFRFGDGKIRVAVQDECGKIDLNDAPLDVLAGLFRTVGIPDAEASRFVTAIMQRRAAVLGQTRSGAPQYQEPFLAVDEVRGLPGMTPTQYERVQPYLTVYAGQAGVNPLTAPAAVLESLPGATPDLIAAFVAARSSVGSAPIPLPPLIGVSDLVGSPVHVVTITSEGISGAGAVFIRQVVADVASTGPVHFRSWGQAQGLLGGPGLKIPPPVGAAD